MLIVAGLASLFWPLALGMRRRGLGQFAGSLALMPAYLLLVGVASWQALFEMFCNPYAWAKTEHGTACGAGRRFRGSFERLCRRPWMRNHPFSPCGRKDVNVYDPFQPTFKRPLIANARVDTQNTGMMYCGFFPNLMIDVDTDFTFHFPDGTVQSIGHENVMRRNSELLLHTGFGMDIERGEDGDE